MTTTETRATLYLRIPSDLAATIGRLAAQDLRSVNNMAQVLLEEAVYQRTGGKS